jgi:hypothetical protein
MNNSQVLFHKVLQGNPKFLGLERVAWTKSPSVKSVLTFALARDLDSHVFQALNK